MVPPMTHEPSAASPEEHACRVQPPVLESFVAWFEDLGGEATPRVGGKGANLGEMARAGLPVPPGFVVTVDAFRSFLEESGFTVNPATGDADQLVVESASGLPSVYPEYAEHLVRWGIEAARSRLGKSEDATFGSPGSQRSAT